MKVIKQMYDPIKITAKLRPQIFTKKAKYIEPKRVVAHSWSKYIEQSEIRKSNL